MKYRILGADFETDHDDGSAWVVQWSISTGDAEAHGSDLDSYIQSIYELTELEPLCIVYFHNFAYDMRFQTWLFQSLMNDGWQASYILRAGRPIELTFALDGRKLKFRDSMAKMPGDLRSLARSVGMRKLESPRGSFYPGWSSDLTEADFQYVDNDARIVAVAMNLLHSEGRMRATASSDAWHFAREMIGRMSWDNYFPRLSARLDGELRHAYWGGLNVSEHQGYYEGVLTHEDVHSMYPTVMTYDLLPIGLPTLGKEPSGDLWVRKCRLKLKLKEGMIAWFQFKDALDAEMEGLKTTTPVVETAFWHQMWISNIDIETVSKWYDIEFDPAYEDEYFNFKGETGIFAEYIDHWYAEKESQPKGSLLYNSAKRMMNALYGRFALNPEVEENELIWNDDIETYDFLKSFRLNEDNDAYVPFALFVTAHARRRLLENAMAVGPENVVHCDTDSVIHIGPEAPSIDHSGGLGTWGIESRPYAIWEGGFKRYIELLDPAPVGLKSFAVACAGVPQRVDDDGCPVGMWVELLDDPSVITRAGTILGQEHYRIVSPWLRSLYLENGRDPDDVDTRKLIPVKVHGGVILEPRQHQLNDGMMWRFRRSA